ncbi:hypothetical protein BK830_14345 [Listeria monocytogenes]|uniref:LMxysn_1693 family intestinal colonization protein n=1 Tax=Listeria monocytogenes TaxID=1639 RepID=UPI000F1A454A|nr:hypothetical protein [Listeria monocytogenes]EAE1475589.1 hypothetical protein [Listeria monocytogenes]EAE7687814.1 hypothetical protein [Listeria monocytogenes]EAF0572442.1 hypothetical protein [Listeria monocytogenes]EAW7215171.1 hypothetical protein [Listeria monocytogenes]EDO0936305.1 hypothetical protein [Listeria monocytogenes]
MKKFIKKVVLPVLLGGFVVFAAPSLVSAHEGEMADSNEPSVVDEGTILDENLEPVTLDTTIQDVTEVKRPMLKSATGFHYKTVSHSIKKISTKKIKIENHNASFSVGLGVGPVSISVSSVPKGRCQLSQVKANVTVKVKKYENGSGKYVGTYTYKSNGASYKEHKKI